MTLLFVLLVLVAFPVAITIWLLCEILLAASAIFHKKNLGEHQRRELRPDAKESDLRSASNRFAKGLVGGKAEPAIPFGKLKHLLK